MKKGSTYFLRATIVVLAALALTVLVWILPTGIITDETGYYRPILIGMYVTAIPFFIALYQALKLLNYIDKNTAFSEKAVNALKKIKYCAVAISGAYILGMPYIYYAAELDDAPGVILVGLVIIGASFVIATFAGVLESLLQNVVAIKSENELTV